MLKQCLEIKAKGCCMHVFLVIYIYIHTYKLYLTTLASSAKFAGFHKRREKQNIFTSKKNTKRV